MTNIFAMLFFLLAELSLEAKLISEYSAIETNHQIACPRCGSHETVKNGSIHNGKPKNKCKSCGYQFVINPTNKTVSDETKQLIDKLLLERLSLRGIKRVTGLSWSWLQNYVNDKLSQIPRQARVLAKKRGPLIIECDELWSFVFSKKHKFYVWLAIDRFTREIIGCYIGDRTRQSAKKLWESLPGVYRQCAVAYTDFWKAYETVIPNKRHRAVGKETGQTNHIERFNNTLRQRVSRLVRKSLSFSKNLENHIGAIWYFIHDYNAHLAKL
jgi:IS1 family transposase/transposase-like protein